MIKVLFICHGNICRSPMAEYVMKDLVRQSGREDEFVIASAATSREELGNPVYPPVRRKLAEHGIRCDGHAARQMTRKDYEEFGYLIGMDRMNLSNMARICGGDPEGKCSLLLAHAGQSGDVADPWYTGDFEATWQDVNIGCRAWSATTGAFSLHVPSLPHILHSPVGHLPYCCSHFCVPVKLRPEAG